MAIACCVCTAVWFIWLAHQASTSLALTGGFLAVLLLLHSPSGWSLRSLRNDLEKRNGQGGKWGGTQTGSGCNFLRKLSEPFPVWPIRCEEREEARQKGDENEWDILKRKKKSWCPQVFPHETWLSKLNQTNLWSHSSLSSHGNQIRKLMQCINETQCWTNEEQNSNDNGVNRGKWP